jgi:hypothetical protein
MINEMPQDVNKHVAALSKYWEHQPKQTPMIEKPPV